MRALLKTIGLFLLLSAPAFGQNVRVDNIAFTSAGLNAAFIANATITVCTSAGSGLPCTPKVSGLCVSATDVVCDQGDKSLCAGYVMGVLDAKMPKAPKAREAQRSFSGPQAIDAIVQYLQVHPERLDERSTDLIMLAVRKLEAN